MKKFYLLIISTFLITSFAYSQKQLSFNEKASEYFSEIKIATKKHKKLWDMDLYGPILIVNPYNRKTYSNYPDKSGILKKEGNIYVGQLPKNIPLGNISVEWAGLKWAMVLTIFIKDNKQDRIELFSHELFHRSQPLLNFPRINDLSNQHLDIKEGRVYLRLELEALIKALHSTDKREKNKHIKNALTFRKYRYKIFPNAHSSEASIEVNEGIASYTGKVIRSVKDENLADFLEGKINEFYKQPSYVQLFAYNTLPAYGFLLRESDKFWNKKVTSKTNLTDFFISAFSLENKIDLSINIDSISNLYDGITINKEETEREISKKQVVAAYKEKFLNQAHFEIKFEKKRVAYDTRYIVAIEDLGFVYPSMKATDNWGVLEIKDVGGFLNKEKNKVIITIPTKIDGNNISGDGWTLILNDGYFLFKDETSGNYILKKK